MIFIRLILQITHKAAARLGPRGTGTAAASRPGTLRHALRQALPLALALVLQGCAGGPGESPPPGPSVSVAEGRAVPGEAVTLTATGLPPDTRFDIGVGPPDSEYHIFAEQMSDAEGRLIARIPIPAWAEPGQRLIFALSIPDSAFDVLSDPIPVVSGDR